MASGRAEVCIWGYRLLLSIASSSAQLEKRKSNMQIDFTKLQKLFIDKIKDEEKLMLRGQDVSFEIRQNYEFEQYNLM